MESLVVPPTAMPEGTSEVGDEFFFLKLLLRYTAGSASQVGAVPIESQAFGAEAPLERIGFHFGSATYLVL